MRIKQGVILDGIQTPIVHALAIACSIWDTHHRELVITSGIDGKHLQTSLHYDGLALDFRDRDFPETIKIKVVRELKEQLGPDYDVILESDHVHVEYQPKG